MSTPGPIELWNAQIDVMCAGGMTRTAAVRKLVKDNSTAHRAFVAEVNRKAGRPRRAAEFERMVSE